MSSLEQGIEVDYYKILNVTRNATPSQICQSYRDLALHYHPSLQHQNKNAAYHRFCQASQAFDVLFDVEKKKIYDQQGEQKLKEGVLQDTSLVGKYKFTSDPQEIFEKFFGSRNVFEHLLEVGRGSGQSHPIFRAQYPGLGDSYSVPHLEVKVPCNLSQLYNGCTKEVHYDKKVLSADGKNAEFAKESRKITINPGQSSKEPLVFPEQGHSQPGYKQSLLIFKIVEVPEKNFKRDGNDLVYTARISLLDALDSKTVTVTDLSGEVLQLHFDEVISPQTRRVIEGKGMPIKGQPGKRGNLIVKFNIEFPQQLNPDKKDRIVALLRE